MITLWVRVPYGLLRCNVPVSQLAEEAVSEAVNVQVRLLSGTHMNTENSVRQRIGTGNPIPRLSGIDMQPACWFHKQAHSPLDGKSRGRLWRIILPTLIIKDDTTGTKDDRLFRCGRFTIFLVRFGE